MGKNVYPVLITLSMAETDIRSPGSPLFIFIALPAQSSLSSDVFPNMHLSVLTYN